MDINAFRTAFPEFADVTAYPDAAIEYWSDLGVLLLNAGRWGQPGTPLKKTRYDYGLDLFTAHNLAVQAGAARGAAGGGLPGGNPGPVNSKSVDKVSVGYDVAAGTIDRGGPWNLTSYGTRFLMLAELVGAGPLQF